ncbi:TetR/AcrR family transcriptional regulator [Rhodococcoides yunnanense]|uniref:TetR/AcrR family transcriptional regulator n=1 Tax=Rhodococcoides yunnanense TaxID=278209 RepID=UPI000A051CB0|nr:TetR family transcriptional regulator [Rhodococcus yunnanensis]
MDRRIVIADAAISLIAEAGIRALTHRAIDGAAGMPAGSTSYYFRTKRGLVTAVVARITESSRAKFEAGPAQSADPVDVTVEYVAHLLSERMDHLKARHALLIDPSVDAEARAALGRSLFSVERAVGLFGDRPTAEGYVALCEGLVLTALAGGYTAASLRVPLARYFRGTNLPGRGQPKS